MATKKKAPKKSKKAEVEEFDESEEKDEAEESEDRDDDDGGDDTGVYRVTEVIGTSPKSWEDAAKNAIETASKSLRDLRIAEVSKLDVKIEGGKVVAYRARLSLSFKYQP
jgi:flavin-binding protein dodecin